MPKQCKYSATKQYLRSTMMDTQSEGFKGESHHPCPRCGGVNVPLTILEDQSVATLPVKMAKRKLYRIHCKDCDLSTRQNIRIIDTINEWNKLKEGYANDK